MCRASWRWASRRRSRSPTKKGIHNSTPAIYIAISVLGDFHLMVPAAIYSASMYVLAIAFGFRLLGRQPVVLAARA
jgi:BASS family bile acid:Na+ symporter